MKPIEAIESPSVLSPLAPYLSESEPLVGPTRRRVASNGISARPAVYAEYPLTSWKYNVKTKASEENASPLKRLDKLPVVKIRFLNKDRSRMGDLVRRSIDRKTIVRTRLVKRNKIVDGESSPPVVNPRRRLVMAPENVTAPGMSRSEERRVGKKCRSRWSPYH